MVGGSLLKVAGGLTADLDCCCCINGICCACVTSRALYLTIDNFTLDAGETCDAGCVGFGVTAKLVFGGSSAPGIATWYTEVCGDDGSVIIAYTLLCDDGTLYPPDGGFYLNQFSGGNSWIFDNCVDNNKICVIKLDDGGVAPFGSTFLGAATCDPFYLQQTAQIIIYEPDGVTQCATGTMRVTVTE